MENKNNSIELEDFAGQVTKEDAVSLLKHMGLSVANMTPEELAKYIHVHNHDGVCSVEMFRQYSLGRDVFEFFSYGILRDSYKYEGSDKTERLFLFLQWMADRFPEFLENFKKYSDMEQKLIMQEAEKKCSEVEQMATDLYWYKEKQKPMPGYYVFTGNQPE